MVTSSRRAIRSQFSRAGRAWKRYALLPVRGVQGSRFTKRMVVPGPSGNGTGNADLPRDPNPLEAYFDANVDGPGIWKWRHYFDIYDAYFSKFVGQQVTIVEIGIYSGGSLGMWRSYFGKDAQIVGIDIEPSCTAYETEAVRIFIGDQGDPSFWDRFRKEVPDVDIVIDDGGHQPHQQIVTLEALLPHLRPGGVYICEDVIGALNPFHYYVCGLARRLNARSATPTALQRSVESVAFYPYLTVIQRRAAALDELVSPKHGTEWQPFLDTPLPGRGD